jgi:hypothetical protein
MFQRLAVALLVLASPAVARAQKTPDRLLPAGSQLYIHWDGFAHHKDAYEKTAIAKMMKGDMGKFLRSVWRHAEQQLKAVLAGQIDPELLQSLTESCEGILHTTGQHGFALGVEVRKLDPPDVQAVLVLPKGGGSEKSVLSLLRTVLKLAGKDAPEVQAVGRKAYHLEQGPVHLVWWAEDGDAVVALGTEGPESLLRRLTKKKGITERPLYRQTHDFKEFKTWARGYIDLASLTKVIGGFRPEAAKLIDELGLDSLKSLTFHAGFDGPAELGVVELDVAGPRKGLLRLMSKDRFTLADLPPMPEDIKSFSADSLEISQLYPVLVQAVESVVRVFAPDQAQQVKNAVQQAEQTIGVNIGEDIFGCLGSMVVQYSAWAEGPLGLGQVTLVKVKDADKLEKSLAKLFKGLNNFPNVNVKLKASKYHGVKLHQIQLGFQGGGAAFPMFGFSSPSYAIHKGWLVVSQYPQPIQGFILREQGELPAWKASGELQKAMAAFPKDVSTVEMSGISVSDPRPGLKFVLSLLPVGLSALNTVMEFAGLPGGGGAGFDVGLVPNAYEATRHLFPNVTVTTVEGGKLRSTSRTSLAFPF